MSPLRLRALPSILFVVALPASAPPARAFEGRVYLTGDVLVGITRGEMSRQAPAVSSGVGFQFGVGLIGIPLTLGLGARWFSFDNREFKGSWVIAQGDNGEILFGPTVVQRTIEIRHFDVVLRLEPEWRRIRPFAEATGGTGQYFVNWTQRTVIVGDQIVDEREDNGDLIYTYGFGAGLNFEPFARSESPRGSLTVVVSLGVRWLRGGPLTHLGPSPDGDNRIVANGRSELSLIVPFVGLGIQSASPHKP